MNEPRWQALMQLSVEVGDLVTIGPTTLGERRVVPITGGTFEGGDGWRGRVLPGGADWQLLRADGVLEVDARYVLEDEQGQRVQVVSQGLRHGPPEAIAALARGETVDPSRYYFRTALRFEAAAPALQRLNRVLAVGIGAREERVVRLAVFALG
uniref:UPF0311 protein n=1 Tax=uncultured bacterium 51 TaxID=1748279 RepID=A0A0U3UI61_9BACT|nr:hypothetical protein [uncultured bacterium 51]